MSDILPIYIENFFYHTSVLQNASWTYLSKFFQMNLQWMNRMNNKTSNINHSSNSDVVRKWEIYIKITLVPRFLSSPQAKSPQLELVTCLDLLYVYNEVVPMRKSKHLVIHTSFPLNKFAFCPQDFRPHVSNHRQGLIHRRRGEKPNEQSCIKMPMI